MCLDIESYVEPVGDHSLGRIEREDRKSLSDVTRRIRRKEI